MAVATVVDRASFNRSYHGWLNLRVASTAGIAINGILVINGGLQVTVHQAMPRNAFNCRITTTPRGSGQLLIKKGHTVTG